MHFKTKLHSILGELLFKPEGLLTKGELIKNITLNPVAVPSELNANKKFGGFVRIMATDEKNALAIKEQITHHQNEIPHISVHITDRALPYRKRANQPDYFTKTVIIKMCPKTLLKSSWDIVHKKDHLANIMMADDEEPKKIVIDYGSPNIAKPIHYGHLRSTIIGNCVANLNQEIGNQVVRLNYLGDWGTQYGLLGAGLEDYGKDLDFSSISLENLINIYVESNERGARDEKFYDRAKKISRDLEFSENDWHLNRWRQIRDLSVRELKKSYEILGINYDIYDHESKYAKSATELFRKFSTDGRRMTETERDLVTMRLSKNQQVYDVPVLRSDGSSLYISRDACAAIDRKERFKFDRMLYVAGSDQERHFYFLRKIIEKFGYDWYNELEHVKIGKVIGMSSRSGKFILLSQIIEEATERFIETTMNKVTTKLTNERDIKDVSKQLAISNLFIYDMRHKRTVNYSFSWDLAMASGKFSGVNIQLACARLHSLIQRASEAGLEPYESFEDLDFNAIASLEAVNLMSVMDELDSGIRAAYDISNPSHLVDYANGLCNIVNRARQSENLWVLGERREEYARTRLTLFAMALHHIERIVRIFGLVPLKRI